MNKRHRKVTSRIQTKEVSMKYSSSTSCLDTWKKCSLYVLCRTTPSALHSLTNHILSRIRLTQFSHMFQP